MVYRRKTVQRYSIIGGMDGGNPTVAIHPHVCPLQQVKK